MISEVVQHPYTNIKKEKKKLSLPLIYATIDKITYVVLGHDLLDESYGLFK